MTQAPNSANLVLICTGPLERLGATVPHNRSRMFSTDPQPPGSDDSQDLLEGCLHVHRDDLVPFIEAFMKAMAAATGEACPNGPGRGPSE